MEDYKKIALKARRKILEMLWKAQTSHLGSNFSSVDILAVLFERMNLKKDKLVVSKGWIAASVYYFLAEKGIIPKEDLERYCQPEETEYIGLIEPRGKFGLEFAGGSMSQGIAAGVGFALAERMKHGKDKGNVYVLESDGGMQGGITWEAAQIAAHHKLDNLVVIVDNNKLQAMGKTDEILSIEDKDSDCGSLLARWNGFGWDSHEINGHNFEELNEYIPKRPPLLFGNPNRFEEPTILIAHTIKGKGWKRAENNNLYHYKNISDEEYQEALKELNEARL